MQFIIIILFLIITILSFIVFKVKGLLILLLTVPLIIMYFKSNNIIDILKKNERKKDKIYLSERKEVEFVSSRDRKKAVIKKEKVKKTDNKKEKKERKKENNKRIVNKKDTTRKRKNEGKIKKKRSIGKMLLTLFLVFAILCVFLVGGFMIYIVATTEDFDPEALKNQDQTVILDRDGNEIATLGNEKRESIEYDDLPQVLIDAIVATEDSRFYQHNGVDMARFLKASVLQVLGQSDAGGASTLTMQVVKNNLTDKTSSGIKGIIRKFKDVYLSVFFMEKKYSKQEILQMYVNDSGLGGMIYGVEEASNYYFGKTVSELSLPEAALLAGMYQAPTKYNPYKYPEAAYERRNTVLTLMVRHGYITEEEKNMANAVSIESMLAGTGKENDYQGYIDTVIEEVMDKTGNDPKVVSMKIYTALDRNIQEGLNKVLNGEAHKWADDYVQAGIVVTNVNDGTIVAIGAGRNREAGDWNYATHTYRQPGSTAKPLFDYGPGFEYNDYSTYTLFNDERWAYTNGPEIGNWDGTFEGLITLRRALSFSRNIPALKAFQTVDTKNIVNFVNGLGLDVAYSTRSENYKVYDDGGDNLINEAYSIGGVGHGFTPLEMAEAYACFANGGYHIESHTVTKIEYRSTGEVVEFNAEREKVMSDSTAYLMNNVLQYAVEHGFNGGARVYGSTVAAKTGTSNLPDEIIKKYGLPYGAVNDLWTVAYTPEYSIALWYGYKEVTSEHYLSGASAPKDAVMKSVMQFIPKTTKQFAVPSSVVAVTVEKDTWPAKLPSEYTPDNMKLTEYFKKGTQPTEVSNRYAKFDDVTNLRSTKTDDEYKITWNFKKPEVLDDAYLSKYFSNSVYGNQSANYLKNRIDYNKNTLGGFGYGIYTKSSTGVLERIAFTEDMEYVYKPTKSGEITLVIKAEYGIFKDNASNGKEVKIKVEKSETSDNNSTTTDNFIVKLSGGSDISITKGTPYVENGITATYNGNDVSNDIIISYQLGTEKYSTIKELQDKIDSSDVGTYKITYTVIYKGNKKLLTRTIKIIDKLAD